jgi:hypothetical protein
MRKPVCRGENMQRSERGEGRLSTLMWLVLVVGLGYAGWNVGPVYLSNYTLTDKMQNIAMLPRWSAPDEKALDLLMKYVREEQLTPYLARDSFNVYTGDGRRTITCRYVRTVNILPGWPHTFVFQDKAEALQAF